MIRVPETRGRDRVWRGRGRGRGRGQGLPTCRMLSGKPRRSRPARLSLPPGGCCLRCPRPPSSPLPINYSHFLEFSSEVTALRSPSVSPAPWGRNRTICSPLCCPGLAQALGHTSFQCACGEWASPRASEKVSEETGHRGCCKPCIEANVCIPKP